MRHIATVLEGTSREFADAQIAQAIQQAIQARAAITHAVSLTPSGLRRVLLTDASIELDRAVENIGKAGQAEVQA